VRFRIGEFIRQDPRSREAGDKTDLLLFTFVWLCGFCGIPFLESLWLSVRFI